MTGPDRPARRCCRKTFGARCSIFSHEVVRRTTDRGEDLISVLLTAKEACAPLPDPEIVANMATVLPAGNASINHSFTNDR
jgi:cytochrome P450